jgi:hypothetical protein
MRHRAAQERLSQSVPTLCECVKAEPVIPLLVDSTYSCGQWWWEEFCNRVALQHLRLSDLQANGHTTVPDQNVIFDQNGMPRDINNVQLRRDLTHEPSDQGSPPLEYHDEPDSSDSSRSDPLSHGDNQSQLSRHSGDAHSLRFEHRRSASHRSSRSRQPSHDRSNSSRQHDR